jgi:hypothetical protein
MTKKTYRVGITGQAGFVGTHLYNLLGLYPASFNRIPFDDAFFESDEKLDAFVSGCDVIVHLAAMNRHEDPEVIRQNGPTPLRMCCFPRPPRKNATIRMVSRKRRAADCLKNGL